MVSGHPSEVSLHIPAKTGAPKPRWLLAWDSLSAYCNPARTWQGSPQGLEGSALGTHPTGALLVPSQSALGCGSWVLGHLWAPGLVGTCALPAAGGGTAGKLEQERCLMFCSLSD